MSLWHEISQRLGYFRHRAQFERELADEVRFHIEARTEELEGGGMERREAEAQARREFGPRARAQDETREAWHWRWLEQSSMDVRFAIRSFLRSPVFTAAVVVSLALGIGANTAIFAVVRAILLDPLPYPEASRLVMVWEDMSKMGFPANTPAVGNYAEWKARNSVFEGIAALQNRSLTLTGSGEPERLSGRMVTHDLFGVLGVAPVHGRTFSADEDSPGADRVAVISYALWQSRFGGQLDAVGGQLVLDGAAHTVIGVMPPGFDFPEKGTQIWVPMAFSPERLRNRGSHLLRVVARMRPGVTLDAASKNMEAIAQELAREYPATNAEVGVRLNLLRDGLVGKTRTAVLLLLVVTVCVLLIACANIANLLLARAISRQREIAARITLGAGRGRLVRQMLVESLLLSTAGAALGCALAAASLSFLKIMIPPDLSSAQLVLDTKLLLFAAALCAVTTGLFGTIPAWYASRLNLFETLKQSGPRSGQTRSSTRARRLLVIAQTAFAMLLLIAAGLILRSFRHVQAIEPGFRGERVLTVRTALPQARYREASRRAAFYSGVLDRVQALPGVTGAGFTSWLPYTNLGGTTAFYIEGRPDPPPGATNDANIRLITPGYLSTMGMTVLRGRLLANADHRADAEPVAVINQTMARTFWPGDDGLNHRFRVCNECPWIRTVGVVGDVHQMALDVAARPEYFVSFLQVPQLGTFAAPQDLAIRAEGDVLALVAAVRRAVQDVDPQQPVAQVKVMSEYLEEDMAPRRFQTQILGGFAILAVLLAALGLYGVLSFTVAQRTHEIGVRMALGATSRNVVASICLQGVSPALAGLMIGLIAAYLLANLVSGLLYGVEPRDPLTFTLAGSALGAATLLAVWIPARKASRIEPAIALRQE